MFQTIARMFGQSAPLSEPPQVATVAAKPHFRKVGPKTWKCEWPGSLIWGFGETPAQANADWQRAARFQARMMSNARSSPSYVNWTTYGG